MTNMTSELAPTPPEGKVRVLVISGSMGAGKTTVLGEVSDVLTEKRIVHAAIDVDNLANGYFRDASALVDQNLGSMLANYVEGGVSHFVLAEAVEDGSRRTRLAAWLRGADVVVCRLTAPIAEMQRRVRLREPGMRQATFVARVAELESQ